MQPARHPHNPIHVRSKIQNAHFFILKAMFSSPGIFLLGEPYHFLKMAIGQIMIDQWQRYLGSRVWRRWPKTKHCSRSLQYLHSALSWRSCGLLCSELWKGRSKLLYGGAHFLSLSPPALHTIINTVWIRLLFKILSTVLNFRHVGPAWQWPPPPR